MKIGHNYHKAIFDVKDIKNIRDEEYEDGCTCYVEGCGYQYGAFKFTCECNGKTYDVETNPFWACKKCFEIIKNIVNRDGICLRKL